MRLDSREYYYAEFILSSKPIITSRSRNNGVEVLMLLLASKFYYSEVEEHVTIMEIQQRIITRTDFK